MKNNKGFSLVELIIVIAIMAILVGVMAPQLMKWIEKSKYASDIQTITTIEGAIKTAMVDCASAGYEVPTLGGGPLSDVFDATQTSPEFVSALTDILEGQSTFTFESKAFDGAFASVAYAPSGNAGSSVHIFVDGVVKVVVLSNNPTDYPNYDN